MTMPRTLRLLFVAANVVVVRAADGIVPPRRTIASWVGHHSRSPPRDDVPPPVVGWRSASSSSSSAPRPSLPNRRNNAAEVVRGGDGVADVDVDGDDRAEGASMREGGRRRVPFVIQNAGRGTRSEVDEIARLCVDVFFNGDEEDAAVADAAIGDGGGGRRRRATTPPWKALQLAYLRKFQTADILARNAFRRDRPADLFIARRAYPVVVPSGGRGVDGNGGDLVDDARRVHNAEPPTTSASGVGGGGARYRTGEIVGFCEVSERNFGLGDNYGTGRRRDGARITTRPYLSNLSVAGSARNSGVGSRLLDAAEEAVRGWNADHTEIVLQVEEDNPKAIRFYKRRGWEFAFADPTCRRYDTSGFFLRESRVTKYAMVKRLDAVGDRGKVPERAGDSGSSLIQKLRSSFFVQKVP
jgi:ribosomal protein S18 acetylase RimI-like enzyme